ncbi:MAG: hypothetical protein HQL63_08455 [Magnetococcales bacterium]|nr:hypothetical protein [Magnetococcales bacterium]
MVAIRLNSVSSAPAATPEEKNRIRQGGWPGRIWFPRHRSGSVPSSSGQPEIWPRFSCRVAISAAGRLVAEMADKVSSAILDMVRRQQLKGSDIYGPDGRLQTPSTATLPGTPATGDGRSQTGATSAANSIWPLASSRVTLSDASRLASGVVANLTSAPEQQDDFLAQIREADEEKRFSSHVLEEARRLVQAFMATETS